MGLGALCLILAAIFVWGTFSARAAAISTPIFFVAIGVVMAQSLKLLGLEPDPHLIKVVAEVTLVWVLFADASRVRITDLRADRRTIPAAAGTGTSTDHRAGGRCGRCRAGSGSVVRPPPRCRAGPDRRGPRLRRHVGPADTSSSPPDPQRRKWSERRHCHSCRHPRYRRHRGRGRSGTRRSGPCAGWSPPRCGGWCGGRCRRWRLATDRAASRLEFGRVRRPSGAGPGPARLPRCSRD